MIVNLHRTFSEYTDDTSDTYDQDWGKFLNERQGRNTWEDLHEKPLTVVLGEAGIGKTIEFKAEVGRLQAAGHPAFFIPLNQLSGADAWQLVLTGNETEFDTWAAGDEIGYFFLDAVDEARLKSHSDFERALAVVQRALGPHLTRVRIAISSRVTDWSIIGVRSVVDTRLAKPIALTLAAKATAQAPLASHHSPTVDVFAIDAPPLVDAFVVGLDPLSSEEARRCAAAFDLQEEAQFWEAVADGDYEFMATRPLDLRWMVVLWNQRRSLGTYLELIEANISNRLLEFNESYEAAGEALSVDQLRNGIIELAAAAEFGGCAFFNLNPAVVLSMGELAPHAVLTDWKPSAVRRLLATAVFDEASFGRVAFHHRSIREYLAAQWVAKQLALGVPLHRLQGLFAGRSFGHSVLIPARRASLSWLAAISVKAREWVVHDFPEILLFEGDPQAWDVISATKAFVNHNEATKRGLQMKWYMSASECMRVGRALEVGKVAQALADTSMPKQVRRMCFDIARHAKLVDCASLAFTTYRNAAVNDWEKALSLDVLEFVGTADQRQAVMADLKGGLLVKNELIAHALPVVNWTQFTESELSAIFKFTHGKAKYTASPMVQVVKNELLPVADLPAAVLLLGAVMASLLHPVPGKRFARFPESNQTERNWLLDALPACYERVLTLLPQTVDPYLAVCMEAAERIEAQRDSWHFDRDVFNRLHKAIAQHPELRWSVALAIAQSVNINMSGNRLVWGKDCIVTFDTTDLPELTRRANNPVCLANEQDIWFALAVDVAFFGIHGRERANAFRTLTLGKTDSARAILVRNQYAQWRNGAKLKRKWKTQQREKTAEDAQTDKDYTSRLLDDLAYIRDGTHVGSLQGLLDYSYRRKGRREYSDVDFDAIATSLSPGIAAAFEEGLKAYWPTVNPPNPSTYTNGNIPWVALIALAGLGRSLRDDSSIAALSTIHVTQSAQLAVWELNAPPPWFEALARSHRTDVEAALIPWVVAEAQTTSPSNSVRRTLEMALRCAPDVRRGLLVPLVPLVASSQIGPSETLKAVIIALREDGLLSKATVGTVCQSKLTSSIDFNGHLAEMEWLRLWMDEDASAGLSWFLGHIQGLKGDVEAEMNAFAEMAEELEWLKSQLTRVGADALLGIHALLRAHPPHGTHPGGY